MAANLVGKVWSAVITVILIPQYIKYLGIESYGLVGFYGTLIGSMAVLDLGLSTTLNRELAKYNASRDSPAKLRDMTFSLECIYWVIGLFICLLVVAVSGVISTHWVKAEHLPISVVRRSVMLMGGVIAFQWPISLYSGGLTGLEKQVLNNTILIIMTTLRAAGVIIILKFFSNTLEAFFLWQAVISLLYVTVMRFALWKSMPRFHLRARFSTEQVRVIWRFAAGMTGIGFVTFFLSQVDKIVLSKILTLSEFGYYTLAFTLATSVGLIAAPISMSFFPRFTSLASANREEELKILYHRACRLLAAFILPVYFVFLFFSKDVILAWTHNNETTSHSYILAQILVVGSILNSLMIMPYQLIIANGWTRFTLYQNIIACIILVPLLFLLTNVYGATGAAFVWVALNVGLVLVSQPLMHKKLLKHELGYWYLHDVLIPVLPPMIMVIAIKFFIQYFFPHQQLHLFILAAITLLVFAVSILNLKNVRDLIKKTLKINFV